MPKIAPNYKRETLNQLVNLFWTMLCFFPVVWLWIRTGIGLWFYLFLLCSLITGMLPGYFYNKLQLSHDRALYEKVGVKQIRKVVQNGDWIKKLGRSNELQIVRNRSQAKQYLRIIAMYERYHWVCFAFFSLSCIYAFYGGYVVEGILVIGANVIYNVATILLQQYNKLKVMEIKKSL
jgi:hypothetical protein